MKTQWRRGGKEREGDASAQRARGGRVMELEGLLTARATGGAFGATSRGVASLPVVMLRVSGVRGRLSPTRGPDFGSFGKPTHPPGC